MKFAHALLCALGLSLALPVPLYAQAEATPTTTYEWTKLATNIEGTFDHNPNGIIYAGNQLGVAGSFTLREGAINGARVVEVYGDGTPSKLVTLSITSEGKFQLKATPGQNSTVSFSATSTTSATPGTHRFALLVCRGESGSTNTQRMAYTSVIIDGAETLTLDCGTQNYWDGPFRGIRGGSEGMTISVARWAQVGTAAAADGAATTLAIEADVAQMYPITERSAVAWSNLEDTTNPKAYYFTVASNLQLTPIEGVKTGRRVILTAAKFHYNSTDNSNSEKAMSDTLTINGATSETKECTTIEDITSTANGNPYTFNQLVTYTFPVGNRPVVTVGESYAIASMRLPAIQAESPILISELTGNWADKGYNAYCAVEGLAALEPEATVASVATDIGEGLTGGGTVSIKLASLFAGTYTDSDLSFVLRFDGVEDDVPGTRNDMALSFTLPTETFVPGHVYRGELVLVYPDGEIPLAPVKVYEGTPTLVTEAGWVNETVGSLGSTGTWTTAEGIAPYKEALEVDANGGVTFTPTEHVDYAATCDSTWTVQLVADEAFAADNTPPSAEVQGAVRIAEVGSALKVQVWQNGAWADLCAATEGETYTVTVDFHYAKEGVADDADTITYTCGEASLSGARPAGSAQVVTAVSVSDGTQLAALTAERELDQALVNQVTVTAGGEVQDLGETLPERIIVSGTFGYGKHPLLTYSGSEDLASLASVPVEGLPSTAVTYVEEGENGVKTWGIAEKTLVIYPVGDSITYGASRRLKTPTTVDIPVPGGYRLPLYTRLTSAGYTVKYVGDTNSNPAEGLNGEIYHSGHAGWKVDDGNSIYASVTGWSTTVKGQAGRDPDVILLLLGVNDLNGGEAAATTAEQMKKLIWRLAGIGPAVADDTPLYPNAKLLLAKVLDSTYEGPVAVTGETLSTRISDEYNTALETFVNGLTAEQGSARIRLVDLKMPLDDVNGFNYFRYDNLHPSAEGYTQMARNWFAAVEDFLPPLNQAESATVRVTESLLADQITLTFSKAMDKAAAETAGNYTLSNGTVSAATLLDDGLTVRLTLTGTTPGASATLSVAAMADKAGVQSTAASLPVRIGASAQRSTDIADSVCNRTADGYTNPLELIAEWSAFTTAPTAEAGLPAQFGAARRAERPWILKTLRGTPTVEDGLLCLNGGTVTVEVNPD
ncbi:MAG: GDSL-type esterase/lipase family protein, partial [Candidatus Spyradenecus sp.]